MVKEIYLQRFRKRIGVEDTSANSKKLKTENPSSVEILPVLERGRTVGTGTTKPGCGTGDPGYHPRCRFFGGPEMNMVAEDKKKDEPCP